MYEAHFNLSGMPFSLLPDAAFLYPSRRHLRAINHLAYGIETKAGFIVITGEVGAGKTTILRQYIKNSPQEVCVGVITNPSSEFGKLLSWVFQAFDMPETNRDEASLYQSFVSFLVKQYAARKRCLLIIDEAQNLDNKMLEELRMLSNVNNETDQLLQIVLVGQPELLETLRQNNLRQFVQRISVHCHLDALSAAETKAYIQHRLSVVGGSTGLFDDKACATIFHFTGGVPRLINLLCDQSLVYAYSDDKSGVTTQTVLEVIEDRTKSGLSPFKPLLPGTSEFTITATIHAALEEIRTAAH